MRISQCPKCELKFSSTSEKEWHLREDHPAEPLTDRAVMRVVVPRDEAAAEPHAPPRRRRWWR